MPQTAITIPLITAAPAEGADVNAPAAGADATVVGAGESGYRWCIGGIAWSYDGTPLPGRVRIFQTNAGNTVNEATVFDLDVTESGARSIVFPTAKCFPDGKGFRVTVDGYSGIKAKISIIAKSKIRS